MPLVQERQHSGDQLRLRVRTLETRGCCVFLGGNTPLDRPLEISTRLFNFSVHRFLRRVLISEKQLCLVRMGDISPIILSVKYQPEFCPGKRRTNLEFTEVGLDGSVNLFIDSFRISPVELPAVRWCQCTCSAGSVGP